MPRWQRSLILVAVSWMAWHVGAPARTHAEESKPDESKSVKSKPDEPKAGPSQAEPSKAEPSKAKPRARKRPAEVRPGDGILGEWWTEGREGRVRFVRHSDGTYKGIATWRAPGPETPKNPFKDRKNPNPKLRDRSTLGIVIIWNLTYDDGEYTGGYVYNPRDGDTYRFKAELLAPDTLKIRGYMGIALLGQSQVWQRYTGPAAAKSGAAAAK